MKSLEEIYKNPRFQAMAAIVVILIVTWLILKSPSQEAVAPTINDNYQEMSAPQDSPQKVANSWEGTLKLSDNPQKGNLMLQTHEHIIYIKTNRDFSALVNTEVIVTYDGKLESFRLGDIKAK